jgi:hypothetical protein
MNKQEYQDLIEVVKVDKQHIINYLKAYNLKISGKISILFSGDLENPQYKQLWELGVEPAIVKTEFKIQNPDQIQREQLHKLFEDLLNKICNRAWPDNPVNPYEYATPILKSCIHFRSIDFSIYTNKTKVVLVGAICYCN